MQKLLLADDSVTIQRVIELTFSGEDIQVIAVNDGEQAIARIPVEHPDIVLADIGMPKKGGYDVAAFVKGRADLEHIPVLLLAGAFEPVDQARAEQVRCDGVLIKPFEPRQVIERVRELLDGVKGTPAQATADVLRPVERLSPRPDPQPVPAPVLSAPPPAVGPVPVFHSDLALDEYFESLNSAFDSVGHAPAPPVAVEETPAFGAAPLAPQAGPVERTNGTTPGRRRGDSLDDYFDRLSTAFQHAKPAGTAHQLPDGFDELLEESRVPTMDALVGAHAVAEVNGNGASSHTAAPHINGHANVARNPIVEALQAMLAAPDAAPSGATPPAPSLPEGLSPSHGAAPAGGELADVITQRVLERLVPEITATVQRLVQEEVERYRRHH